MLSFNLLWLWAFASVFALACLFAWAWCRAGARETPAPEVDPAYMLARAIWHLQKRGNDATYGDSRAINVLVSASRRVLNIKQAA